MASASTLTFMLLGNDAGASRAIARVGEAAAVTGKQVKALGDESVAAGAKTETAWAKAGKGFLTVGKIGAIAMLAIGVEGVKAAANFQQAMARVSTQAGVPAAQIKGLGDQLLKLAPKVGVGPLALADSLYHVESAGFSGTKQVMELVKASAMLSRIGGDDINKSTQAIIGVLASKIKGVKDANDAVALLNTTVGSGDMRMSQLTSALASGILPVAARVGLSFKDIGIALATMTDNVTPADEVATRLKTSLLTLIKPTPQMTLAFEQIGMSGLQLANDFQKPDGLLVGLRDIKTHLDAMYPAGQTTKLSFEQIQAASHAFFSNLVDGGANVKEATKQTNKFAEGLKMGGSAAVLAANATARMFGGSKTAGVFMTLLGEMDRVEGKTTVFGDSVTRAKKLQEAWATQTKTFAQSLNVLKASLDVVLIKIGNYLIPIIQNTVTWMMKHKDVVLALAGVIGGALVAATVAWTVSLLLNPVVLWGAAIAGLVIGIVELVKHFHAVSEFLHGPLGTAISYVVGAFMPLAGVAMLVMGHWKELGKAGVWLWENALKPAWHGIETAMRAAGNAGIWLWKNALLPAWHGIAAAVDMAWGLIHPILNMMGTSLKIVWILAEVGWRDIGKPLFHAIGTGISWLWTNAFKPALDYIGTGLAFLWKEVVIPAFGGINDAWHLSEKVMAGFVTFFLGIARDSITLFKAIADGALSMVIGLLGAASHLPFVGSQFGHLQADVKDFKKAFDSDMHGAINTMNVARDGINSALGGINPKKTIVIDAIGQFSSSDPSATPSLTNALSKQQGIGVGVFNANGNLFERHTAQIARGGPMRVWAEPETGGEAYIPLAPGKRQRSLSIWAQTGKHLGVQGFADGGMSIPSFEANLPVFAGSLTDLVSAQLAHAWKTSAAKMMATMSAVTGSSGGAAGWAPMVLQALGMEGLSASLLPRVLAQINLESGGNPNAVNNWDSNAAIGQNSRGLLQTIPATFDAYHWPGTSSNIYDGFANIAAAINYGAHRYGAGTLGMGFGHGYAGGTMSAARGWAKVGENGTELINFHGGERVYNNAQTRQMLAGSGGGVTVVVQALDSRSFAQWLTQGGTTQIAHALQRAGVNGMRVNS